MMLLKRRESENEFKKRELLELIYSVNRGIQTARMVFESTTDEELLESCAYEIKYLQARFSFLLRQARALGYEDMRILRAPPRAQQQQGRS